MKKLLALLFCSLLAAGAACAQDKTTAERHLARGAQCTSCHGTSGDYTRAVRKEACLTCHGSYEGVAARTAKVKPNPHDNHYGFSDCSTCHHGHTASTLTCSGCHKFNLKTP